ncbi:MAG: L,D-transpeptidase family protein [Chthoniobacterales bacterium]|nr:L,D-transpeptidase family protein [Chthoniobacterales bacterium]
MKATLRLGVCLMLAALAGCATHDRRLTSSTTRYLTSGGDVVAKPSSVGINDTVSYWDGDGVSGSPSITINLGEQKAFFYKDGRLVGVSMISSGREGYRTPPGQYKVLQKSKDHVSNLYGDYVDHGDNVMVANVGVKSDPKPPGAKFRGAPMPYFLRFHGGYGLHAGFLPGFAASHGCVRMPERMAQIFFANVSHGTPVRVIN